MWIQVRSQYEAKRGIVKFERIVQNIASVGKFFWLGSFSQVSTKVDEVHVEEKFHRKSTTKENNIQVFRNFKFNEEQNDEHPVVLFVQMSINQSETNSSQSEDR